MSKTKFSRIFCVSLLFHFYILGVAQAAPPPLSETETGPESESKSGKIPRDILKLRDPFKRVASANPKAAPQSDLEVIPIDSIKLIGVLTGRGLDKMRAILQVPTGKTYFVTENMRVGVRRGVIRRITGKGVLIREKITNVLGEDENLDTELKLQEDPEKKLGLNW